MPQIKLIFCTGILFFALGTAYAGTVSQAEASLFKVQLRLAESGDPNGEFYVGEMYEQGLGTPRNLELAHQWYEKSAKKGNPEAKDKLANWNRALRDAAKAKQEAQAAAEAKAQARARAQAQALALAKARAAAEQARRRAAAEAAVKKLQREHAEALARVRERARAAALRAKKLAEAKAQATAEAKRRAAAIAAAKTHHAALSVARARNPVVADSPPHGKTKNHKLEFSPDPCKGLSAQFLSTCK